MPRTRSQGIVLALLLGTVTLILYGSLYPFDLTPRAESLSIGEAILELSWARAGRGDRIANVLLYAPLGFCLLLWLYGRVRSTAAIAATITLGIALSFCIEVAQVFIAQRVPSWWDIVLNGAGTLLGTAAGVTWHELGGRMRTANGASGRKDPSAVLIIVLWLAWRLAPFTPHFSLSKVKAAFGPLADPYFSTFGTFHYWVWWTVLAQVIFAVTSAERAIDALLVLIAIVLAGCIVITNHAFIPSELLALTLLLPTLFIFDRLTHLPRRLILLFAVVGLYLYDSFAPVRLEAAATFDLWPFMRWIDTGFPIDWQWLTRRACYFATLFWALKEAGFAARAAVVAVPLVALAVEVAQLLLGQRATITEPALALSIVWVMRMIEERSGSTRRRVRSR